MSAARPRHGMRIAGANATAVLLLDNYDSFTFNLFTTSANWARRWMSSATTPPRRTRRWRCAPTRW
jgi:hypothetical protein